VFHQLSGSTIRLEYEGKIYALMSVSIPAHVAEDKEKQSLFKEVAEDIAFALHAMEVEEERKQAEEALRESDLPALPPRGWTP
jgi:K+-sensing histidine kinase KdpD